MSNPTEVIQVEAPATRSIPEVLNALDIVIKECDFQVSRLKTTVRARTVEESKHHQNLITGYGEAAKSLRTMEKYHRGRLNRITGSPDSGGIDPDGKSTAFVNG